MIGMMFLAVGLLWLALSWYLAKRVPVWLSIRHPSAQWLMRAVVMLVLLVGPFVDHIVGMRQFERLCESAKARIWVSPDIGNVSRAKPNTPVYIPVSGYWINIESTKTTYIDIDTGKAFLSYETFFTKGGRIWGLTLLGGFHSCKVDSSDEFVDTWKRFDIQRLLDQGRKS